MSESLPSQRGRLRSQSPSSSSGSELDVNEDSEGWDDVEPDVEDIEVKDFFSDEMYPSASAMLAKCKEQHDFDFIALCKRLELDFLQSIKLVNYIREQFRNGYRPSRDISRDVFGDDKYLQPTLENDALLFSLDEVLDSADDDDAIPIKEPDAAGSDESVTLKQQLKDLESRFADYRAEVSRTLDDRWNDKSASSNESDHAEPSKVAVRSNEEEGKSYRDRDYFTSYAYADIHETMLKDAVRTDAYRDFIYGNKRLFKDKVVLDVGCGTGILSMFCAKAGAAKVIAVDNSDIIDKTRAIIIQNGLDKTITCIKGKVEEIALPDGINKIDVIVSEWMGYCLLYEAMLDSVLFARDRYLKPDGLMVPSHCTLHVGAVSDSSFIAENFSFWQDVYGFDMTAMSEKIYRDVFMRHPGAEAISGRSKDLTPFKTLDLHSVRKEDLDFETALDLTLQHDVDSLDGFCIWFDTIFLTDRRTEVPEDLLKGTRKQSAAAEGDLYFSTGPFTTATHWQCGLCVIDRKESKGVAVPKGQQIQGTIRFRKIESDERGLGIKIQWNAAGSDEAGSQKWKIG